MHVFLSYSRKDAHFVDRVRHTLTRADIPVWLDTQELVPGTPNWEQAITDALDAAFALVLIASPDAKISPYVQGEVAFAEANHIPIFIIWARGENWSRTVPLHLIRAQHVDARQERYQDALADLIAQIKPLLGAPPVPEEDGALALEVPGDQIAVDLPDGKTVHIRVQKSEDVNDVVNRVYTLGAHQFVEPYTYGQDWVLAQKPYRREWEPNYPVMRVALGWDLMASVLRGVAVGDPHAFGRQDTAYMGAIGGTRWRVLLRDEMRLFGVAGVRRDRLCPGMIPLEHTLLQPDKLLKRVGHVRANDFDLVVYLQRKTGREMTLKPFSTFRADAYIESLDLFILHDVTDLYLHLHNHVAEFPRR